MGRGRQTVEKVRQQRRRHRERHVAYRVIFAIAGFLVVVGGILLLVLPGPGLVVIAVGLAMLALEFTWAERALEKSLTRLDDGVERIKKKRAKRASGEEPA